MPGLSDALTRALSGWLFPVVLLVGGAAEAVTLFGRRQDAPALVVSVLALGAAFLLSPLVFPRRQRGGRDVVVYWRPGCSYCLRLRWGLRLRAGRARWVNIWSDPEAAAYVRSVNDGDETVPTVVLDGHPRTNPDIGWVRSALAG